MRTPAKLSPTARVRRALARLERELSHPDNADIRDRVMKRVRRMTKGLKTR